MRFRSAPALVALVALVVSSDLASGQAPQMVGGNILGYTRVLTTATVLESAKENFDMAIALSSILLAITCFINWGLTAIQSSTGAAGAASQAAASQA